jgi:hypothetical protein
MEAAMKYLRMAIALFVLAAMGVAIAGPAAEPENKGIRERVQEFYAAKEYAKAVELLDQARDYIQSDADYGELYDIACIYSLAGHKQRAIDVLKLAVAAGWTDSTHTARDTDLDNIRNEPEFKQILAELPAKAKQVSAATAYWQNPRKKKTLAGREYELVGMPADRVAGGAREVRDLAAFQGRVYLAPGSADSQAAIISFDPGTGAWRWHEKTQDHMLRGFRLIDGELFALGMWPDEGFRGSENACNSEYTNLYRMPAGGGLVKYRTLPKFMTPLGFDKSGSDFFAVTMETDSVISWVRDVVRRSSDGCLSWQRVHEYPKPDSAYISPRGVGGLVSFAGRVYVFGFDEVWRDGWVLSPDEFNGKEALTWDGTAWSRTDLIPDKGLLRTYAGQVFAGKLLIEGLFARNEKPVPMTTPKSELKSVLYAWDGTGKAKRVYDKPGFSVADMTVADSVLYVLTNDGEVLRTNDAAKFNSLLELPRELNAQRLEVLDGYLYLGGKKGEVYRTKL